MPNQADYSAVQTGFMTKARTLTQYFKHPWQVTDDDSDANRGANHFLILKPGEVPVNPIPNLPTKKMYRVNWNIIFDMQVRYRNYKDSWNEFSIMRDALLNLFVFTVDKTLPGVNGIWDVIITAPEPPGQKPPEGAPTWIGQQMIAIIEQHIDVTR